MEGVLKTLMQRIGPESPWILVTWAILPDSEPRPLWRWVRIPIVEAAILFFLLYGAGPNQTIMIWIIAIIIHLGIGFFVWRTYPLLDHWIGGTCK